jgi:hypothetical protein
MQDVPFGGGVFYSFFILGITIDPGPPFTQRGSGRFTEKVFLSYWTMVVQTRSVNGFVISYFVYIFVYTLDMGGPRLCLGGRSPTLYQGVD